MNETATYLKAIKAMIDEDINLTFLKLGQRQDILLYGLIRKLQKLTELEKLLEEMGGSDDCSGVGEQA